jgi:uncharacterized protein
MKPRRHLVVLAKAAVMGRVKTRLGRDIGRVKATGFYRHTVSTVLRRLGQKNRWNCWLALSPDTASGKRCTPWQTIKQGEGDLGQRMDRAIRAMPPGPVVLIGTDIPAISPDHIEAAFKALGHHDAVFGPAEDGGYWLVGARRTPTLPDLFTGVRWSTEHALSDTLNILKHKRVALLETLDDIDDASAYHRWLGR